VPTAGPGADRQWRAIDVRKVTAWEFSSLGRQLAFGVGAVMLAASAVGAAVGVVGGRWLGRRR